MPRANPNTIAGKVRPIQAIREEVAKDQAEDGTIDAESAEEMGALNAEAVQAQENRRAVVGAKRAGSKRVPWGEDNACSLYDAVIAIYTPASLDIFVQSLRNGASWYLTSQPRSGLELYQAIERQCHGRSDEAEYKITFSDRSIHLPRGVGRLTLPSTLHDPNAPPPSPVTTQAAPSYPWQQPQQPQQPAPAAAAAPAPAPPTRPAVPPPAGAMVWVEALGCWLQMPGGQPPPPAATQPQQPAAPPKPASPPPPGAMVYVEGMGWLQAPGQQPAPPSPAASPVDQFKTAITTVESFASLTDKARGIIPGTTAPLAPVPDPAEPPPTRTLEFGDIRIVQNMSDGQMRPIETVLANFDRVTKFISDERKAILDHQAKIEQMRNQPGLHLPQTNAGAQQQAPQQQPAQQQPAQQAAPPKPNGQRMPPPSIPGL